MTVNGPQQIRISPDRRHLDGNDAEGPSSSAPTAATGIWPPAAAQGADDLMPTHPNPDRTDKPTGLNRRYAHLHTPKHFTNPDHLDPKPGGGGAPPRIAARHSQGRIQRNMIALDHQHPLRGLSGPKVTKR